MSITGDPPITTGTITFSKAPMKQWKVEYGELGAITTTFVYADYFDIDGETVEFIGGGGNIVAVFFRVKSVQLAQDTISVGTPYIPDPWPNSTPPSWNPPWISYNLCAN